MKLYLNIVSENINTVDAHFKLLAFYNILSTFKNFENIDRSDFAEIKNQFQNEKKFYKQSDVSELEQIASINISFLKQNSCDNIF